MSNAKIRETSPAPPGQVDRRQDEVQQALRDVRGLSLLDGVFVEAEFDAIGTKTVAHKLGRKPRGIIDVWKPAAFHFSVSAETDKKITITVAASGKWRFWVF